MKVLAIIGSFRANSINRVIFNHYRDMSSDLFSMSECIIKELPIYNDDINLPDELAHIQEEIIQSERARKFYLGEEFRM